MNLKGGNLKITTPSNARRALAAIEVNVLTLKLRFDAAMQQLDQAMPGFPSGLDGAGAGDGLTTVERLATTPDEAVMMERRLFAWIGDMYDKSSDAATLVSQLGVTPATPQAVKGDTPDGWCENHYRLLHKHEPTRREGGTYCRFCEDVKREYQALPSRALLERKAIKGRVSEADVVRLMKGKVA